MSETISPYIYPILKHDEMCTDKYPFISAYLTPLDIENVHRVIMDEFKVKEDYYIIKSRVREYVEARKVLCMVLRNEMNWKLGNIGQYTGGRDHTTVINAIRTCYDYYDTDDLFRIKINSIYTKLKKKFK